MRILVTSDGPDTLERAAKYTTLFADPDAAITLMIVCGAEIAEEERRRLEELHDGLADALDRPIEAKLRRGQVIDQILDETRENRYDLVVLGIHLRRRIGRLRPKFVARRVAPRIEAPLLIVFPEWDRLRRILVCTSGEKPAERVVDVAGRLAASVGAEITVLHVMSQIPMSTGAEIGTLECDADQLIECDTREGKHLQRTLDILADLDLPAEKCTTKVRHGFVVDEIVRESEEGDFDLVVVGAPRVSSGRSWRELRELIHEDIAERVLMDARRPVLIA